MKPPKEEDFIKEESYIDKEEKKKNRSLSKQEEEVLRKLRDSKKRAFHLDWPPIMYIDEEGKQVWVTVIGQGKRLSPRKVATLKIMQSLGIKIEIYIYTEKGRVGCTSIIEKISFNPKDLMFVISKRRKPPISEDQIIQGTYHKKKSSISKKRGISLIRSLEQKETERQALKRYQEMGKELNVNIPVLDREATDQEDYDQITSLLSNLAKQTLSIKEEDIDISKPPIEEIKE